MFKTLIIAFLLSSNSVYSADEKQVLKTIKKFGKELKKELKKGLKESAAEAIKICHMKAPEITLENSDEKIKIGRVSLKNRNPDNIPKEWMLSYIDDFYRSKDKTGYTVVDLGDKKGLIKPIVTQPLCLKCHGTDLSKEVKKELSSKYPNDKATGYKTGDIRGFFWAIFTPTEK